MGIGSLIWERHGHIALCVTQKGVMYSLRHLDPVEDRCYNYGIGDFHEPVKMAWGFFRGANSFWVGRMIPEEMLQIYVQFDRTIWVQPLPLDADQKQKVIDKLESDIKPANRYYAYDHFADNCTTRIRDIIDNVTGGALKSMTDQTDGKTFRDLARDGFIGMKSMSRLSLLITDIAMGRSTDRVPSYWERMFLPQYLREAVATKWKIAPIPIFVRSECRNQQAQNCIERGVDVPDDGPSGRVLFALVIIALTAPVWLTRLWGRFQRTGLAISIVPYVLLGSILTFLAAISPLPYVRMNPESCSRAAADRSDRAVPWRREQDQVRAWSRRDARDYPGAARRRVDPPADRRAAPVAADPHGGGRLLAGVCEATAHAEVQEVVTVARQALREAYGFDLPDDLFEFWAFARRKGVREMMSAELGMDLCGPFTVLAGGELANDRDRWQADPPEFFTVATGDTDGLHWGYVAHAPGTSTPYVAHFYARDGYSIGHDGSMFDALRSYLDGVHADREQELAEIRAVGEDDAGLKKSLARMDAVRRTMPKRRAWRLPTQMASSRDGLGIVCSKGQWTKLDVADDKLAVELRTPRGLCAGALREAEAHLANGKPGAALKIARDAFAVLPAKQQKPAARVLAAAYHALDRPVLAKIVAPSLAPPTKRHVGPRSCHSLAEAFEDPDSVQGLTLERWGAQGKLPSLEPIAKLTNLRRLAIRGFRIGDLPASFRALKHLERVELLSCALTTFPRVLASIKSLTEVEIMNDLAERPKRRVEIPKGLKMPQLEALDLVACGLDAVPRLALDAKKLFRLSLDHNRLRELPDELCSLPNVIFLSLARNKIRSLPESIGKLARLGSLWIGKNQIAALPESLRRAKKLSSISVGENPLTKNKAERARTKELVGRATIYWT